MSHEPRVVSREEILSWETGPTPPKRKARILVDEQLSPSIVAVLQKMKARAWHVKDIRGLRGRSDKDVARHALKHGLILLTSNAKDFKNPRMFPIEQMPFIVILRAKGDKGDGPVFEALEKVLWLILSYPRYDKVHHITSTRWS